MKRAPKLSSFIQWREELAECNEVEDEIRIAMAASDALSGTHEQISKKYSSQNTSIDRILESAVALNWNALAGTSEATALQIEYRIGPDRSIDYLKLWSSTTRGVWNLICEYWMKSSSGHESGTTFNGGKYSGDFTWMLDAIMQHQRAFLLGSPDFVDGLIQVSLPTDADLASARVDMNAALEQVGSHLAKPEPQKAELNSPGAAIDQSRPQDASA